jgi:hypothetical protein
MTIDPESTVQPLGDVLEFKDHGVEMESGGLRNLDTLSYLERIGVSKDRYHADAHRSDTTSASTIGHTLICIWAIYERPRCHTYTRLVHPAEILVQE